MSKKLIQISTMEASVTATREVNGVTVEVTQAIPTALWPASSTHPDRLLAYANWLSSEAVTAHPQRAAKLRQQARGIAAHARSLMSEATITRREEKDSIEKLPPLTQEDFTRPGMPTNLWLEMHTSQLYGEDTRRDPKDY